MKRSELASIIKEEVEKYKVDRVLRPNELSMLNWNYTKSDMELESPNFLHTTYQADYNMSGIYTESVAYFAELWMDRKKTNISIVNEKGDKIFVKSFPSSDKAILIFKKLLKVHPLIALVGQAKVKI